MRESEHVLRKREESRGTHAIEVQDDEQPDDGLYHGQEAYKNRIKKNQEVPKSKRIGPQRNTSSTIRQVTIVDYQPDVCKDYKGAYYVRSVLVQVLIDI